MHYLGLRKALGGWTEGVFMIAITAIAVGAVLVLAPDGDSVVITARVAGVVAGISLVIASLLFYLQWRLAPDPRQGWLVAATILVSYQVLVQAGSAVARPGQELHPGWPLVCGSVVALLVVGLATRGLSDTHTLAPDPMGLGIACGLVVVLLRLVAVPITSTLPDGLTTALGAWVLLCFVLAGVAVLFNPAVSRRIRWRLAATFVMLGVAQVAAVGPFGGATADLVAGTLRALAGVVWTTTAYVLLRQGMDAQRARAATLEGSLVQVETSARGSRERLHEVRSTVAGLASASQLLDDQTLPASVRDRLEETIRAELGRLERLVSSTETSRGDFTEVSTMDLDETLDHVLDLHRARGRTIAWEPSGARVVAQPDAVAEAINILLENTAAHAGGLGSRVDVRSEDDGDVTISVADSGPGIPLDRREEVFEWGASRVGSPGQGIGLNLARRLVTEQGGTLTLAEPAERGSEFVIRLPAVRRSAENTCPARKPA